MNTVQAMTLKNAQTISTWCYPGEYSVYSFDASPETTAELMNGDYFACENKSGELIGYFCFGFSAQIPADVPYASDTEPMDIGLGLSPALCGRGYGRAFMQSGLDFAAKKRGERELRLAVAAFNRRALSLYQHMGFQQTARVTHRISHAEFVIMRRAR